MQRAASHAAITSKIQRPKIWLILSMLAFLGTTQPAVASNGDGKMDFKNNYGFAIEVKIYHASLDDSTDPGTIDFGEKQKGTTIGNSNGNTFTFRAGAKCKDKKRGFKVFEATSGELITQGFFSFKAQGSVGTGAREGSDCSQKVQIPTYDSNYVSYEQEKSFKGHFTVLSK
jgi:hypothetical protein